MKINAIKPQIFCSTSATTAAVQQEVQEMHNLPCCWVTTGGTALNNTARGEPIAWLYKYDVIKHTYLLDSREKGRPFNQGPVEQKGDGLEKEKTGKK